MAQAYKNVNFSKQDWHSDEYGSRNPVTQKTFEREYATSIVKRVTDGE